MTPDLLLYPNIVQTSLNRRNQAIFWGTKKILRHSEPFPVHNHKMELSINSPTSLDTNANLKNDVNNAYRKLFGHGFGNNPPSPKELIAAANILKNNAALAIEQKVPYKDLFGACYSRSRSYEAKNALHSMAKVIHTAAVKNDILTAPKGKIEEACIVGMIGLKELKASTAKIIPAVLSRLAEGVGAEQSNLIKIISGHGIDAIGSLKSAMRDRNDPLMQVAALRCYKKMGIYKQVLAPIALIALRDLKK